MKMNKGLLLAGVAALALGVSTFGFSARAARADVKIEEAIEKYKPVAGVSGTLSSVGSDTLNNLMTFWSEGFKKHYPNVTFAVEGKGSSTAPPALIDGTADIGPMSREMKAEEIKKFEDKFGYKPSLVGVAVDALAVFVHKDNPIKGLSLPQVDAIFSANRKGGYKEDITKWGQVGLEGEWANLSITLYGRNSASGTYGFFKENALYKGDFKSTVKEQPGSSTVVQLISEDRSAAGYSGIGYKTAGVKTVPISKKDGAEAFDATPENCYSGKYPLSRFLWIYFNRAPGKEVSPVVKEFLSFILSREGQEIVLKDGFIPLTKKMIDKNREVLK
ncbi:MAG: phosphate-binding protein PstS [Planctomycetota bacterium]|nr:phosphate-binding protein [Planctomycetota bacterium]GIK52477.1 MAG: phosphate-binding protein PstS [Planctomycetota bacterium]